MASTYENDLRLEEMATGENSGSWGTKTNTNLELIADAFSYGTEIIADGDTSIEIQDGIADAARSLALKINSSTNLTAIRVVTLAPNTTSKVWIIQNATTSSSSYPLRISAGSGTKVDIATGTTKIIATDGIGAGSNVVELTQDIAIADMSVDGILKVDTINELTAAAGVTVEGVVLKDSDALFGNGEKAIFGDDLEIYHDGNAQIINAVGQLNIDNNGDDKQINLRSDDGSGGITNYLRANGNTGAVQLYHYGDPKLATTTTGIDIAAGGVGVQITAANTSTGVNNALRFKDTDTGVVADQVIGRIEMETADATNPGVNLQIDGIYGGSGAGSELVIKTGVAGALENRLFIQDTVTFFNHDSGDNDFVIRSEGNTAAFVLEGETDHIGMGVFPTTSYGNVLQIHDKGTAGANLRLTDATSGSGINNGLEILQIGVQSYVINREAGAMAFWTNGAARMQIGSGGSVVFNEDGVDADFRVESDTDQYAFFVDGETGGVQMGGGADQFTGMGGAADGRLSLVNTGNGHAQLGLFRQDTSIGAGNALGEITAFTNDTLDNDIIPVVKIVMAADGAFGNTDNPSKLEFYTTPDASETIRQVGYFNNTGKFYANFGAEINTSQNAPNGDFKVSSSNVSNLFYVNAGEDSIGVGMAGSSSARFTIQGPAGTSGSLNSDKALHVIEGGFNNGNTFQVSDSASASRFHVDGDGVVMVNAVQSTNGDFQVQTGDKTHGLFVNAADNQVYLGGSTQPTATGFLNLGGIKFSNGSAGGGKFLSWDNEGGTGSNSLIGYWYDGSNYKNRFRVGGDTGETTVNGSSDDIDFRVGSDDNSHALFVEGSSDRVSVGTDSTSGAMLTVRNSLNASTITHVSSSTITGSGHFAKAAEFCVSVNNNSTNNQLQIPITSQGGLWRQYQVELSVVTGEYNENTTARGGSCIFSFVSLSVLQNFVQQQVTGNISSVAIDSTNMKILINFSSGYTSGTNNYEGVHVYARVLTTIPDYFQLENATLN